MVKELLGNEVSRKGVSGKKWDEEKRRFEVK